MPIDDSATQLEAIRAGNRRALARAITLVESSRSDHRRRAAALLDELLPGPDGTIRVGISGTPGVGKSTFIEQLGLHLLSIGRRPAVLTVDPTSVRSGGSILGDKTRMAELSRRREAFIRPSASGGVLGGVAAATRQVITLCEAAGYDTILVETVGVGQSEVSVDSLTDLFVLLLAPGGGDDLQGIKGGVMEIVDTLVINKADGPRLDEAQRTANDYRSALHLTRPKVPGLPADVTTCSALERTNIAETWELIAARHAAFATSGRLARRRSDQAVESLWAAVRSGVLEAIVGPDLPDRHPELADQVAHGARAPMSAAIELVERTLGALHSAKPASDD
ncbi:MAG: methylmalonyl Co-A mutase-associated GTPase MeaB [Acidimicrobiales bacterium]